MTFTTKVRSAGTINPAGIEMATDALQMECLLKLYFAFGAMAGCAFDMWVAGI